jgi:hypothetical protein
MHPALRLAEVHQGDSDAARRLKAHIRRHAADHQRGFGVIRELSNRAQRLEVVVIAGVRRGGEQQHVPRACRERPRGRAAVGSGPERVRLVDNHDVPERTGRRSEDFGLFDEVERRDCRSAGRPWVGVGWHGAPCATQ